MVGLFFMSADRQFFVGSAVLLMKIIITKKQITDSFCS